MLRVTSIAFQVLHLGIHPALASLLEAFCEEDPPLVEHSQREYGLDHADTLPPDPPESVRLTGSWTDQTGQNWIISKVQLIQKKNLSRF